MDCLSSLLSLSFDDGLITAGWDWVDRDQWNTQVLHTWQHTNMILHE